MDPEGRVLDAGDDPAEPAEYSVEPRADAEAVQRAAGTIASSLRLTSDLYEEYLDERADWHSRLGTEACTEADVDRAMEHYSVPYDDQDAWVEAEVARFDRWLAGRGLRDQPAPAGVSSSAHRLPRRGHVGPRQSRPRGRAQARASSRGGDSGDSSDDPEPAGPGDPVGDTSRSLDQLARQLAERKLVRGWRS